MDATTPLPTGTVTFLFTDIEGSTQLWEQHPDAMRLALIRHDASLAAAIESNHGHVFKTVGDAFCAAFATATDAIDAALAAQLNLHALQPSAVASAAGLALKVRIALHTGAAEARGGDYFGPALNRVARLLAIGHGGQVLLSQTTADLVQDELPPQVSLLPLGSHRLRDLQRPEQVYQLLHPDLPADFPALRSLEAFHHNLPAQLTSFIGREREIAEVRHLLARTRLLTLTGSGGCGKTRLTLQVAADLLEEFPDGVWLVELAALADPALVPQTVAATLGVREEPGRPLTATLTDCLRPRSLLLVLDNCEHLLSACAELLERLLRACPHLHVLASSRAGLGVSGEQTYRVPSLSLPNARHLPALGELQEYEAVRLFVERAGLSQPSFEVTAANAAAVAAVCQRLDGIPLAIELAAARVKALPVERIAERLDDRFRLLTGGSRTALPRQQTLRALIDWSYDLLSEPERTLLRRLSVFAGGFTLEATEAVCAGEGIEEWEVLDLLTSLVEKSLVIYEEQEGEGRYGLLETVRQYARDRLRESGEVATVRARHQDWVVALAERAGPELFGREQAAWLQWLEGEHDNLRAALDWSLESGDLQAGLRIGGSVWRFWYNRGYWEEGSARLAAILSRPEAWERTRARATALDGAGVLALRAAWDLGAGSAAAHSHYEEMLAVGRELGDKQVIAIALNSLGRIALVEGNGEQARSLFEQALALSREAEDRWEAAFSLQGLGMLASRKGDNTTAWSLLQEALAMRRELGDKGTIATTVLFMADLATQQGDWGTARTLFEESLALFRELGKKVDIADALGGLASVTQAEGDPRAAWALLEEALALGREVGHRPSLANLCMEQGHLLLEWGDTAAARSRYEEGLALRRAAGVTPAIAAALLEVGHAAWRQGESVVTQSHAVEALGLFRKQENRDGILASLESLAAAALAQGRNEHAARLAGAVEALREALGVPGASWWRRPRERIGAAMRAALGEEAFAAAWEAGRAMSLEDAVALALDETREG